MPSQQFQLASVSLLRQLPIIAPNAFPAVPIGKCVPYPVAAYYRGKCLPSSSNWQVCPFSGSCLLSRQMPSQQFQLASVSLIRQLPITAPNAFPAVPIGKCVPSPVVAYYRAKCLHSSSNWQVCPLSGSCLLTRQMTSQQFQLAIVSILRQPNISAPNVYPAVPIGKCVLSPVTDYYRAKCLPSRSIWQVCSYSGSCLKPRQLPSKQFQFSIVSLLRQLPNTAQNALPAVPIGKSVPFPGAAYYRTKCLPSSSNRQVCPFSGSCQLPRQIPSKQFQLANVSLLRQLSITAPNAFPAVLIGKCVFLRQLSNTATNAFTEVPITKCVPSPLAACYRDECLPSSSKRQVCPFFGSCLLPRQMPFQQFQLASVSLLWQLHNNETNAFQTVPIGKCVLSSVAAYYRTKSLPSSNNWKCVLSQVLTITAPEAFQTVPVFKGVPFPLAPYYHVKCLPRNSNWQVCPYSRTCLLPRQITSQQFQSASVSLLRQLTITAPNAFPAVPMGKCFH